MNIIEMKGVKKDYPLGQTTVHALKGVDFTVEEGDFLSIIGPSGSGKTTLLNIIGCIDLPTAGSIKVDGEVVYSSESADVSPYLSGKKPPRDSMLSYSRDDRSKAVLSMNDRKITDLRLYKIGFIFQTFNLIPVLDVAENVEFPLLLMENARKEIIREIECKKSSRENCADDFLSRKMTRSEVRERAEMLIEQVGLKEYIRHRPAELSGGQRQRVAIARALVTKPDIILADEPTANLDSVTGSQILNLMKELNQKENTTFIFSTHDPDVLQYAKRVVKIRDGLMVQQ